MSRLIIKNLPKNISEKRIKDLFGQKGTVTDLQLKYTEDGKFRRFGFIGFKTEEEAAAAKDYFHNSCVDTSKITVDFCAGLGDPSKPKSWSKYAADSKNQKKNEKELKIDEEKSEKQKKKKKNKDKEETSSEVQELLEKHKDDPMFSYFLETHAKDDKEIWELNNKLNSCKKKDSNDDESSENEDSEVEQDEKPIDEKLLDKNVSDKEFMELLKNKSNVKTSVSSDTARNHGPNKFFTVKLKGLGYNHKKKDIKMFFKGIKAKSIRVPQKIKGIAFVGFKTEKQMKLALNKNKSFLDGKCIFVTKYEEHEKNETKNEKKLNNSRWKQQEEALKNEEDVGESGRIFLRNLSYETTEDDIRKLFEKYGPVTEVNLPVDKITRKRKGFGCVTFLLPEHAVKAYTELDGTPQNGRMLHLLPAKTKTSPEDLLSQEGLSFKQKKELKEKLSAGSSHNWNTLFLGHNAVADAIAKTYNTTKENVLRDEGNTTAAVRLALGETQIVQETQKFLEENGVKLNAFNQAPKKRSKTVILVKDLPAGTQAEEIREMFSKHGPLGRVLLPPSGITALVEYLEPSEARKGFQNLAYKRFKHLPLYLEWAPDDSLEPLPADYVYEKEKTTNSSENQSKSKNEKVNGKSEQSSNIKVEKVDNEAEDEEDEEEPEPDTTLFVKNLNFTTTDERLRKHFSKCGKIHYANVTMKKDPQNAGNKLSMGYGFVRYKYKSDAERALKELQMSSLEGKTLELKRSERTLQSDVKQVEKKTTKITEQTGTKILVRNIPFQANANEIKDLFKAFGEIKSVRLPKKLVGDEKHRGFGFVEFYTKKEAKVAFKALCQSTHLYGRRLVLEWAQMEEAVDDIRKRTAKHFHQDETVNKKSKKGTLNPELIGLEVE